MNSGKSSRHNRAGRDGPASAVGTLNFRPTRVVLVLQGGGALGAYQAGVYQAMHERGILPDWVVGTSIGAVNGALIAGNPPERRLSRLKEFWDGVARDDILDMEYVADPVRASNTSLLSVDTILRGVPGFFTPRPFNPFAVALNVAPESASFYDTGALAQTLHRLVDFSLLRPDGAMRYCATSVRVTTAELVCFDSAREAINEHHVMASGALPPGFPPVRIDGELYWDGGLYSNTPLDVVLDDTPHVDTLCFMVDLWRSDGMEPTSLAEVQTRQKDVSFASRSQRHIQSYRQLHELRRAIQLLREQLPAESRDAPEIRAAAEMGSGSTLHIVRLVYSGQDWNMPSKDINFSRGSLQWRWEQGYAEMRRALARAAWQDHPPGDAGIVVHEADADGTWSGLEESAAAE